MNNIFIYNMSTDMSVLLMIYNPLQNNFITDTYQLIFNKNMIKILNKTKNFDINE